MFEDAYGVVRGPALRAPSWKQVCWSTLSPRPSTTQSPEAVGWRASCLALAVSQFVTFGQEVVSEPGD